MPANVGKENRLGHLTIWLSPGERSREPSANGFAVRSHRDPGQDDIWFLNVLFPRQFAHVTPPGSSDRGAASIIGLVVCQASCARITTPMSSFRGFESLP